MNDVSDNEISDKLAEVKVFFREWENSQQLNSLLVLNFIIY